MAYRKRSSRGAKTAGSKRKGASRSAARAPVSLAKQKELSLLRDDTLRQLLNSDAFDAIVVADLSAMRHSLQHDYRRRVRGDGLSIFHSDKLDDCKEILRHIEAITIVLRYYGAE